MYQRKEFSGRRGSEAKPRVLNDTTGVVSDPEVTEPAGETVAPYENKIIPAIDVVPQNLKPHNRLGFEVKNTAAKYPNKSAAVVPPAAAVSGPVRAPSRPFV